MRNKLLLITGNLVTFYGTAIFLFAINVWLIKIDGTPLLLSKINALILLPVIFLNSLAGWFVDKFNKKGIIIIGDIFSALFCFASFVLIYKSFSVTVVIILLILLKLFDTVYSISTKSIIKELFDNKQIKPVISFQTFVKQLSKTTAPLLGGVLILFIEPDWFFLFNGISYLLSAICSIFLVKRTELRDENKIINNKKMNFSDGFKYFIQNKPLVILIIPALIINFFFAGLEIYFPYISISVLRKEYILSIILASEALGGLSAPFFLKLISKITKKESIDSKYYILLSAICFLICFPFPIMLYFGSFLISLFVTLFNIEFFTRVQHTTDEAYMGRIMGIIYTLSLIVMPIGSIMWGFLGVFFKGYCIIILGLCCLVFLAIFFFCKAKYKRPTTILGETAK